MDTNNPLFSWLSPYELAGMIRSLDSSLVNIESEQSGDELILVYTFAMAGKAQRFAVKVGDAPVPSIVQLYPAARTFEEALEQALGLVFQPQDH